jgi:predicted nucleic acid-binding protein
MPLTLELHKAGISLARDHKLAFYDGLIVAAAIRSGCTVLYSEDLQDGRTLQGVTIRDPFAQ